MASRSFGHSDGTSTALAVEAAGGGGMNACLAGVATAAFGAAAPGGVAAAGAVAGETAGAGPASPRNSFRRLSTVSMLTALRDSTVLMSAISMKIFLDAASRKPIS